MFTFTKVDVSYDSIRTTTLRTEREYDSVCDYHEFCKWQRRQRQR